MYKLYKIKRLVQLYIICQLDIIVFFFYAVDIVIIIF